MNCYRCDSEDLPLAPLSDYERNEYGNIIQIVLRVCQYCGLLQNHYNIDDPLTPKQAMVDAPDKTYKP